MKKIMFYVLLVLSLLVVCCAFDYADEVRGYNSTGGEVFMIALPLLIVNRKLETVEREKKANQLKIKQLSDQLYKITEHKNI